MTTAAPITTYAQALVAQSSDEILAQLFDDMATLGVELSGFDAFSVQLGLPQLQARAEEVLQRLRVVLVQAGYPTTAALAGDDWVDVTLSGFFQEARLGGTYAQWLIPVTAAPGAGPFPLQPGDLVAQDQAGTLYASTSKKTIPAGGTRNIAFTARTIGIAGNAAPGTLDHLVVSPAGLSVTNPPGTLVVAGTDKESNAAYLFRCLGKWGMLAAGGNITAYNYLIPKAAPTVTRWLTRDDNPFGPGTIGVCLANAAGPATSDERTAVAAMLQPKKPLGSGALTVFSAAEKNQTITAVLLTDGSSATVVADATAAIEKLGSVYPIGSVALVTKLYRAKIIEILMQVPSVTDVILSGFGALVPGADVDMSPYDVMVFTPITISVG